MTFNVGFQEKTYSEVLMYALSPWEGLGKSIYNLIQIPLGILFGEEYSIIYP